MQEGPSNGVLQSVLETNRALIETNDAIVEEMRTLREAITRTIR